MLIKYLVIIGFACGNSLASAAAHPQAPTSATAPQVTPVAAAPAFVSPAANTFKQLSALVGEWEGKFDNGRAHRVTYRMSARGHALVETWALSATSESITIYHLDGDKLVADHYCPQGNAPRLELKEAAGDKLDFSFRDGTNLSVAGKTHQHSFWMQIKSADEYLRGETYVPNGANAAQLAHAAVEAKADRGVRYSRVKP